MDDHDPQAHPARRQGGLRDLVRGRDHPLRGDRRVGGDTRAEQTPIVIGTKNFGEAFVLGQLYKQALEAAGFDVSYKENIGSTELIQKALTSGQITMYLEYIGIALTVTLKRKTSPKTAAPAVYAQVKRLYDAKGYTLARMTPFQDVDAAAAA